MPSIGAGRSKARSQGDMRWMFIGARLFNSYLHDLSLHSVKFLAARKRIITCRIPPAPPPGETMPASSASMQRRIAMYNGNSLKIGLFGANCSSGRSATKVPERWSASWEDCLALARLADEAGLDFMLPIARWKGYGGETDFHGASLETITWAVGLLCATKRMTVFGTVHAPLFHPLIAAKEFVTADHIGQGRVGVNIVVGWNEGEFDMFGVQQREHDTRYAYAQEWVDVVK